MDQPIDQRQDQPQDRPLLTVITPTYNRADYLPGVIESVLSQGYEPLQYIVLDDGSTDDTKRAVEPYLDRIEFDSHENMGETRTVNRAFGLARGEIVCVINSDDPLYPGSLDAGVRTLVENADAVVAYPDWDYIDADGEVMHHHPVEEYSYERMLGEHICMPGPGAFFRREVVEKTGGRDAEFRYVGDFEFWLRAALVGPFVRIPENLATFRVHASSASEAAKGRLMASEDIRMLDKYYARNDLPEAAHRVRAKAYAAGHYHASQVCGRARILALWHFAKALGYKPGEFMGPSNAYKRKVGAKLCYQALRAVFPTGGRPGATPTTTAQRREGVA